MNGLLILYRITLIFLVLLNPYTSDLFAQNNEEKVISATYSNWKGFDRMDFRFQDYKAHIIFPHHPRPDRPWIWRARFPEWHTESDSILLTRGFHRLYIQTDNLYGSPKAMEIWDAFYQMVTQQWNLAEKVVLEGVSRGGLFIYSWAKRHPDKVICIYGEAPVCDFRSWPGGRGTGAGSSKDWNQLKQAYGFGSDEEAMTYPDQPFQHLDSLAKFQVPILHMIGLEDEIVPVDENTWPLIDAYIHLGGPAMVVPCTQGKTSLQGHHFDIDSPHRVANFIESETNRVLKSKLPSESYHTTRKKLENSYLKFHRDKKGRVAFLGGSITFNGGWRDSVMQYLRQKFPNTEFDFIAAGIPSMGTTPSAFRLDRDILSTGHIDLLFEEAAVNDATNGRTDLEQIRGMEGIVRHFLRENPTGDMVMMHFVDPEKMTTYRKGGIPRVIQNHEKVAEHYQISSINLAKEVTDRIDAGEFTWEDDFKNLHPSPFGQGIYAQSIIQFLENSWPGAIAEDDKIKTSTRLAPIDQYNYDNGQLYSIEPIKRKTGWVYQENWEPTDGKGTRPNYTNVPMLIGEYPTKPITFKFTGRAVGIAVAAGPDAGMIEYSIDGEPWQSLDLFTQWSSYLHLPWYYTLAAELTEGKHQLRLRLSENKNSLSTGQVARIRYFYVNK